MNKPKKKMTAAEKAAARVPDIPDPAKEAEWAAKVERMKPTKKERRGRFALLIGGLVVLLALSFTLYTCNYSHENDVARAAAFSAAVIFFLGLFIVPHHEIALSLTRSRPHSSAFVTFQALFRFKRYSNGTCTPCLPR